MIRKVGQAIAGAGAVLVVLLAVGASALWLGRYSCAKSAHDISPNCELAALGAFATSEVSHVRLPRSPSFTWDEVQIYPPYSRLDDLRAAGISYEPAFNHVPEIGTVVLFVRDGRPLCAQFVEHESGHHLEGHDLRSQGALQLVLRKD